MYCMSKCKRLVTQLGKCLAENEISNQLACQKIVMVINQKVIYYHEVQWLLIIL